MAVLYTSAAFFRRNYFTSFLKRFAFQVSSCMLLVVVCFLSLQSSQSVFSFLILVTICLFLVDLKFRQREVDDTVPDISFLTLAGAVYKAVKNRISSRRVYVDYIYGISLWYPKEGMFSFKLWPYKFVTAYSPKVVEEILSSTAILRKGFPYGMLKPLLKEGLVTSTGSKWHARRKLLTPAFHFKILETFIPIFNEKAKILVKQIGELMEKQESISIMPVISRLTLDIICETAMGKTMNTQEDEDNDYLKSLRTWGKCILSRILYPWLWTDVIFYRTNDGKRTFKSMNVMEHFTTEIINTRLKERSGVSNGIQQNENSASEDGTHQKTKHQLALLDLLLDLHMKDKSFSLKDIGDEVGTIVFAGHDTTSAAISLTLYLLGLYQDVQRRAQEEVDEVLGDDVDRTICPEDIKKLKYLHMVMKETIRLYPPVPEVTRVLEEDTVINGYKISKGTTIAIIIYMLHRNAEYFPNPEEFNPERFDAHNSKNRNPFAYIPFSAGPRNCIGQRFATNEIITVLATVLRHFNITSLVQRDKINIELDLVLMFDNELRLKFSKRQFLRTYEV